MLMIAAFALVLQGGRTASPRSLVFGVGGFAFSEKLTLAGAGEVCFRGLYEVSLALVGVASPAYFQ